MASSVWSAFEGATTVATAAGSTVVTDPGALLNHQLASALSTMGDAQYWEETISPATIRQSLQDVDPSNPGSVSTVLRAMKWLLAAISKGRDVSDFYPLVVKLVGFAHSLEVRKMVYMYLVQYADYDAQTRELSLLSINSFQRGMADAEALIRALALRVLTSIHIADILQIQILGVQKCAQDVSPYVRKCAANALSKLYPRCDAQQQELLLEIMTRELLDKDTATMVLTSALISMSELVPDRLELLHNSFRKICHLLTDMDEWGQVVIIDLLARYCRRFFKAPASWRDGTAERIDKERRVRRTLAGITTTTNNNNNNNSSTEEKISSSYPATMKGTVGGTVDTTTTTMTTLSEQAALSGGGGVVALPPRGVHNKNNGTPRKVKRRVVKKGFYSDEEDESTEEEVYADSLTGQPAPSLAAAMKQTILLGGVTHNAAPRGAGGGGGANEETIDMEELELDPDHRMLLHAAMPLLKSRNAGVVLAVCSLQYYCGISSVRVRSAMGKALVRIHRDKREIQYVVLQSIRTLVSECPSAFAPFLHDFFVKAMDPPFTRLIKLDILTSLALEPRAIEVVLKELRLYVRDGDKAFSCAAVHAVGKIAELARIVFDRHGHNKSGNPVKERSAANQIALNCIYGLLTLTQTCDHRKMVVGEAVTVMARILQLLRSDCYLPGDLMSVQDPNHVQDRAMRRIVMLLASTLNQRFTKDEEEGMKASENDNDDDNKSQPELSKLEKLSVNLPAPATAAALWIVGEFLSSVSLVSSPTFGTFDENGRSRIRLEFARLVVRAFPDLDAVEKEQGVNFASKLLISKAAGVKALHDEAPLCEHILSMGRVDVNADVRDRARYESGMIRIAVGLKHDLDATDDLPSLRRNLSLEDAKRILLGTKPASSSLPLEDNFSTHSGEKGGFRFGTLSSLVGHRARSAYQPLPPWASKNSPSSLRDPPVQENNNNKASIIPRGNNSSNDNKPAAATVQQPSNQGTFYASSSTDEESSSESSSSRDSNASSSEDDSSSSGSSGEESSASSDEQDNNLLQPNTQPDTQRRKIMPQAQQQPNGSDLLQSKPIKPPSVGLTTKPDTLVEDASSSSGSDDDSSSESSDDDSEEEKPVGTAAMGNLIPMEAGSTKDSQVPNGFPSTSVDDDMRGLVLSPIVTNSATASALDPNFDRDSSAWIQLVRPEHAQGLSVSLRYLRGVTKAREAQLMGLMPEKPSLVCMQFRFENMSQTSGTVRRIRLMQKSSGTSSGSSVGPKKVVVPPEIDQLSPGQRTDCVVGIDFATPSDRDGSLQAKFDMKFGTGGVPIEIKPTLGDVLLPHCLRSVADFDREMAKKQGFQRVESKFNIDPVTKDGLPERFLRCVAMTPVIEQQKQSQRQKEEEKTFSLWQDDDTVRLAGTLPASLEPVYALVSAAGQMGRIIVCSENALAANSIMNLLKRTAQSKQQQQ